jgi:Transglutaminase-like superfamily
MQKSADRPSVLARLLFALPKALWTLFVVAAPFIGAWVASSLAAYSNRSVGWAAASGLLLFPVLPLGWETYAHIRRKQKGVTRRFLTFTDRLTLRTLTINLLFLGVVIATHPESAFVALSTRGDWMLAPPGGGHSARVEQLRRGLFAAAGGLEWLYRAVRTNPYREPHEEEKPPTPSPSGSASAPVPVDAGVPASSDAGAPAPGDASAPASGDATLPAPGDASAPAPSASASAGPTPKGPEPKTSPEAAPVHWPLASTLHPVVAAMPPDAETSIDAVAHYIADREPDPFARVKALHDWVADRIAYDGPAFLDHHVTMVDADPEIVFKNRVGVCAGYANLMRSLGRAVGIDIAFVPGDARIPGMKDLEGASHAWNAVNIEGHEYLVDATWDAGHLDGREFKKKYGTDYLFAPPKVFGLDHMPDDAAWQLRDEPLTVGDFLRQPMLTPGFYRRDLVLVAPLRSQVTVDNALDIQLVNPRKVDLDVKVEGGARCPISTDASGILAHARCSLSGTRAYTVEIYAGEVGEESHAGRLLWGVGQVEANNSP